MRSNIRQVAALAGVSRTTVSNVLLGREGRIAQETREAVLRAVEELGYVPVHPTLQNRKAQTRVLALAVTKPELIRYDFHSKVYVGICDAALRNDYDVLTVLRSDPDWATNRSAIRLLDGRSDGILLFPGDEGDDATLEALTQHGAPAVTLFRRSAPKGISWIDPDNEAAVVGLIDLLVERGHRKILHLTYYLRNQFDFRMRYQVFLREIQKRSLPLIGEGFIETGDSVDLDVARRIAESGATAVLCGNDWLAFRLWDGLEAIGVRVPEDISITGIDNQAAGERKTLTTMGFTYEEAGILAVRALIDRIEGADPEECNHIIPVQLFDRASVRTL